MTAPAASAARARPCVYFSGCRCPLRESRSPPKYRLAAHVALQLVAIQQPHRCVAVIFVQFPGPLLEFPHVAGFDGDVHLIGPVVAIDGVFPDQGLRQVQRLDRQVKQTPRVLPAHLALELLLADRQAKNRLTAAAARSAVADAPCLEQGHFVAALRQMQRGRTAGDAAAEHRHIARDLAAQALTRRPGIVQGVVGGGGGKDRRMGTLGESV